MTMLENGGGAAAVAAPEGLIKETTTQGFMKDVIEESKRQPVLIDFWAPWCGPCKQLTPILEKVVKAAKGEVKLVKMNIDDHPAIPGPDGHPVDPGGDRLRQRPARRRLHGRAAGEPGPGLHRPRDQGQGRRQRDRGADEVGRRGDRRGRHRRARPRSTRTSWQRTRPTSRRWPVSPAAMSRTTSSRRRSRSSPRCRRPSSNDAAVAAARAALEVAEQASSVGPIGELEQKVAANPLDHQARFDLAVALNAAGKRAGGRRSVDGDHQARSQMERGRRAQAARAVLRGLGPDRRSHRCRPQKAVVGSVCLMPFARRASEVSDHADERDLQGLRGPAREHPGVPAGRARCCCRAARCRSTFSSRAISRWSTIRCATATG